MTKLVECVPNFSEGRDRAVIDAIAAAIASVPGVRLLDVDPGADANRTVYTFVGPPEAVADAAFRGALKGAELIDMTRHRGEHPRLGALDVCPIVPVAGVTMDECVALAHALGRRLADALGIPVYFYEHAAAREERRSLAAIRAGEYEGLARKLADPAWTPDCGPAVFNPKLGAAVVGARRFLIAYNVNLNTRDRRLAHEIALAIRETGRLARDASGAVATDAEGRPVRVPGRLKAVRARGWYLEQYRQAQVSINLTDYETTPLHRVFETVREEADRRGLIVTGSELIGMTPLAPMREAGRYFLAKQGRSPGAPEPELIEIAVRSLGLDQLAPFDPARKIIEYAVREPRPLMALPAARLVDEVSSGTPAPGGGSAAALAGSLAAALCAMAANVTVGKPGYAEAAIELGRLAERAQQIKSALADAVDDDARAYTAVVEAKRLRRSMAPGERARDRSLHEAFRRATDVPLATMRLARDVLALARDVAGRCHPGAVPDVGVAVHAARAALEGAALNVAANLDSVGDPAYRRAVLDDVQRLTTQARQLAEEALAQIAGRMGAPGGSAESGR